MRILYIDIDACNPSHLGCWGYARNTSPAIDAIAGEGVAFRSCYTSDAPCLPSRTALYAGRFGIQTGVVGHGGTAAEPRSAGPRRGFRDSFTDSSLPAVLGSAGRYTAAPSPFARGEPRSAGPRRGFRDSFTDSSLPAVLGSAGRHTALISPFAERHSAHWFTAGFREIHNTGKRGMEQVDDVAPVVDRWLGEHGADDDWYLHVNFWDAHTPYRVPEAYGNPFENEPLPAWLDDEAQLHRHMALPGPHTALDPGMYDDEPPRDSRWRVPRIDSMDALRRWIDGYDTSIRYIDDAIASIVRQLKSLGVYEETAIIISADHGECQGHLGIYGEHGAADHGTCNIPLIVRWPGGRRNSVDEELHYHLDLAPTLLELLDGGAGRLRAPGAWNGSSFAASILDGAPCGREQLVLSQCAHVCQRAVRWDRWLYIRTYHDGFHDWPDRMLFDLSADALEQQNLADAEPELCAHADSVLHDWHTAQMTELAVRDGCAEDPMWRVMSEGGPFHARLRAPGTPGSRQAFEQYCARLEDTGRGATVESLRSRHRLS